MTNPVMDNPQLVSGAAILLSFFVGYKYALRCHTPKPLAASTVEEHQPEKPEEAAASSNEWVSRYIVLIYFTI